MGQQLEPADRHRDAAARRPGGLATPAGSRTTRSLSRGGVLLALAWSLALPACDDGGAPPATPAQGTPTSPSARPGSPPAGLEGEDQAPAQEPWFADRRVPAWEHESGADGRWLMPEIMGGGGALADLDDDGRLDLYLVQGGRVDGPRDEQPGNRLFLQRAPGDDGRPRFEDVSAGSGADDRGYGMGVAAGDLDGDGDVDLAVTNVGPDVLLRNDGGGRFRDITATAGTGHAGWGTSASFLDIEADGDLDLFVVHYLDWTAAGEISCYGTRGGRDYCSPQNYEAPARDSLYRNEGDGRFRDVSEASGIASLPGTGLGVGAGDLDGDGDLDVFVANDGMPDALWINDGDGAFVDNALLAGCAVDYSGRSKAGMGVALADLDHDADLDLIVCNLDQQSDSFFLNDGDGLFRDATARAGLATTSQHFTRFGMGLVDLDNDGWLDLFQANGRVTLGSRERGDGDPFAEPDLLQRGLPPRGPGEPPRFEPVDGADGTAGGAAFTGRAALFGDLDDDGGLDLVVVNRDGPLRLLHNLVAARTGHHWLGLDVREASGAPALGARVTVRAGERSWTAEVRSGSSYLAANDPRVHLGLGDVAAVESVSVRWVDGTVESFEPPAVDGWHGLHRGQGR